jgi:aspartate racemase
MRTIGLIGGASWHSTMEYYRLMNDRVSFRLGGLHSAKIVLWSVDLEEYAHLSAEGRWDEVLEKLAVISRGLRQAGAECLVLAANTLHRVAVGLRSQIDIPLIHIAECVAEKMLESGYLNTGLLGTRHTLSSGFYKEILSQRGIRVLLPEEADIQLLHGRIYDEMAQGIFKVDTRKEVVDIILRLRKNGAQSITLACTELPILMRGEDFGIRIFNTTRIHAEAAVEFALQK